MVHCTDKVPKVRWVLWTNKIKRTRVLRSGVPVLKNRGEHRRLVDRIRSVFLISIVCLREIGKDKYPIKVVFSKELIKL